MTVYNVGVSETYTTIGAALTGILGDLTGGDLSTGGGGIREVVIEKATYVESVTVTGFNNASATDFVLLRAKAGDEHNGIFGAGVVVDGAIRLFTTFTKVINLENKHDGVGTSFGFAFEANRSDQVVENHLCQSKVGATGVYNTVSNSGVATEL